MESKRASRGLSVCWEAVPVSPSFSSMAEYWKVQNQSRLLSLLSFERRLQFSFMEGVEFLWAVSEVWGLVAV